MGGAEEVGVGATRNLDAPSVAGAQTSRLPAPAIAGILPVVVGEGVALYVPVKRSGLIDIVELPNAPGLVADGLEFARTGQLPRGLGAADSSIHNARFG